LDELERFADIVESIADPMVVYDSQWRVRFENAAALRTFLRDGREHSMLGRTLWAEYPDLEGTSFEREMKRAMSTRTPVTFVEERRTHWTEVRCYPLTAGGLAVVWKDITEEKRAQLTLHYLSRASEIFSASLDYEVTTNALAQLVVPEMADWCSISLVEEGRIRPVAVAHVDPAKVQLVRDLDAHYPSDINASTHTATVIRTGKSELVAEITDEMLDRALEDPEYRALVRRLGFTSLIVVPLIVRDEVLGAMALVSVGSESSRRFTERDMALAEELGRRAAMAVEHARLYSRAVEARRAAEIANETKMMFLARMSHELRTPLNAIAGYADLLAMGIRGPLTPEQHKDIDRIIVNERHLMALITDVLNYAKLDAGRLAYDMQPTPLAEALEGVEQAFAPQFAARGIAYRLNEADVSVVVDRDKLQQVLLNLVSNAVKFTETGGTVTVSANANDHAVEVTVADTGIGIPVEKLEIIFDPFVQFSQGRALPQGVGLGLAISRELARGMGGDLWAEPAESGARFVLRLARA
jgi:signal transduction histidine kinase